MEGGLGNCDIKRMTFLFKWNKLLLLVEIWWDQKNHINEPLGPLRIRKTRIEKNGHFLINNKQWLCEHGGLHPMIERKVNYIPVNAYNNTKETFIKNWRFLSVLGLYLSEDIPNFTNNDISESNTRCHICIR